MNQPNRRRARTTGQDRPRKDETRDWAGIGRVVQDTETVSAAWHLRITRVQHNISELEKDNRQTTRRYATRRQGMEGNRGADGSLWSGNSGSVQVLFMDYLTCPGYNPPKASIRIIASSSSRLCGCCAPERRGIAVILSRCRDPLTLHPLLGFLPQPPCHLAARTHASTFASTRATPFSSGSPSHREYPRGLRSRAILGLSRV